MHVTDSGNHKVCKRLEWCFDGTSLWYTVACIRFDDSGRVTVWQSRATHSGLYWYDWFMIRLFRGSPRLDQVVPGCWSLTLPNAVGTVPSYRVITSLFRRIHGRLGHAVPKRLCSKSTFVAATRVEDALDAFAFSLLKYELHIQIRTQALRPQSLFAISFRSFTATPSLPLGGRISIILGSCN